MMHKCQKYKYNRIHVDQIQSVVIRMFLLPSFPTLLCQAPYLKFASLVILRLFQESLFSTYMFTSCYNIKHTLLHIYIHHLFSFDYSLLEIFLNILPRYGMQIIHSLNYYASSGFSPPPKKSKGYFDQIQNFWIVFFFSWLSLDFTLLLSVFQCCR